MLIFSLPDWTKWPASDTDVLVAADHDTEGLEQARHKTVLGLGKIDTALSRSTARATKVGNVMSLGEYDIYI
jgi:hypothetical protein